MIRPSVASSTTRYLRSKLNVGLSRNSCHQKASISSFLNSKKIHRRKATSISNIQPTLGTIDFYQRQQVKYLSSTTTSEKAASDKNEPLDADWGSLLNTNLNSYYRIIGNKLGIKVIRHDYTIEEMTVPTYHNPIWTATFQCPITNTLIPSGKLKSHFYDEITTEPTRNTPTIDFINGKYYYRNKRTALRASVAAAIDALSHQEFVKYTGLQIPLENFCEKGEEPYLKELIANKIENSESSKEVVSDISSQSADGIEDYEVIQEIILDDATKGPIKREMKEGLGFLENPMSAISYLHRIYNPKDLRAAVTTDSISYFSTRKNVDGGNRMCWTAQFQSPVTNEIFNSGSLIGEEYTAIDEKIYYQNKKMARLAAVGLAIDCFIHRGGWLSRDDKEGYRFPFESDVSMVHAPFCIEKPYNADSDVKLELEEFVPPPPKEKSAKDDTITPKGAIFNRYQALLREPIGVDCFATESVELDVDGTLSDYWTSTFECPVTGKLFPSGTLINVDEFSDKLDVPALMTVDGVVYYKEKKNAEHAAAGRTFDILSATNFFPSFGIKDITAVVPQFCEEDPHSYTEEYYEDDEDSDEFVIQEVPKAGSLSVDDNSNVTTLDIILDTWADNNTLNRSSDSSSSDAVATARAWLQKMKHETGLSQSVSNSNYSLRQSRISTFSCNAILRALANSNGGANRENIDNIASDILNLMIKSSTSDKSLPCSPDVSTFNAFMRCFKGGNPYENAKRAENFLADMRRRKNFNGVKLPEPNCDSFNTVMKLWLECATNECYDKNLELFQQFESFAAEANSDINPNKEVFLTLLQSLAVQKDFFDHDEAQSLIECMEHYVSLSEDDEMIVDTEVYNASLSTMQRDHLKTFIKDQYEYSFVKSCEGSPVWENAVNVENWFHDMERLSVKEHKLFLAPDITTYVAVIQNWLKTCSEDGLEKAEKWAFHMTETAATDSAITPTLDIFRDILLAWAYSGSPKASAKIEVVLENLETLSETFPELKPDESIRSLLFLAWNIQGNEVESSQDNVSIAEKALKSLQSSVFEYAESGGKIPDSDIFVIVLDLWRKAAFSSIDPVTAANKISEVANLYNDIIMSISTANNDDTEASEAFLNGDQVFEEIIRNLSHMAAENEDLNVTFAEDNLHLVERFLLRREKFQQMPVSSKQEWGIDSNDLQFPRALYTETLRWCKLMTNPTRNGDAIRISFDILRWTLYAQKQELVSHSNAIDIYTTIFEVIKTVVLNDKERTLIAQRIAKEITEVESGNISFLVALNSKVPEELQVSDIFTNIKVESKKTKSKKKRGRKKRVRKGIS